VLVEPMHEQSASEGPPGKMGESGETPCVRGTSCGGRCKKQDLAGWARLAIWFVQNLSAAISSTDLLSIHLPTVSHELLNFNPFVCYLPYFTAHGRQVYERP